MRWVWVLQYKRTERGQNEIEVFQDRDDAKKFVRPYEEFGYVLTWRDIN